MGDGGGGSVYCTAGQQLAVCVMVVAADTGSYVVGDRDGVLLYQPCVMLSLSVLPLLTNESFVFLAFVIH